MLQRKKHTVQPEISESPKKPAGKPKKTETPLLSEQERLRANEDKFKFMFEHSIVGKSFTLPSGEINVNQALCDMLGYSQEELSHKSWQEITYPEDIELTQSLIDKLLCGEQASARFMKRYLHKNGDVIWTDVSTCLRRDEAGQPLYFMTEVNDITARKQAEDALRESALDLENRNNFINTILENLAFGLSVHFIDSGVTKYINPAYSRVYGWPAEEMKDVESFFKLIYPDPVYSAQQMKMVMEDINSGDPERMHWVGFMITTKTGEERFIEARNIPLPDQNLMISTAWDITERKRAEDALASLNLKNELILNSAAEGILGLDLQGNHTFVNPAAARMLGYESEELLGRPGHSCWHHSRPDGSPYPQEDCPILTAGLNGVEHRDSNTMFWRKDGTGFPVEYISTPILEQGKVTGAVVTFSDITERKQAEEALHESEERYKLMFESAPLAINITRGTEITYANPSYLKMFGFSNLDELKNVMPLELFTPEARLQILENIQRRAKGLPVPNSYEAECFRKDRTIFPILMHLTRTTFADGPATVGFIIDITERKQAEAALRESEAKFRRLFQNNRAILGLSVEKNSRYIDVNEEFLAVSGYSREDVIGKTALDLGIWADLKDRSLLVDELRKNKKVRDLVLQVRTKSGEVRMLLCNVERLDFKGEPCILLSAIDITERKRAEEQVIKSLAEKETLLRELYHRTKNNMAVITALLALQADFVDDPALTRAFAEAQDRIGSMALVHQKLYEAQDLSHINLREYINDLVAILKQSYKIAPGTLSIVSEMEDTQVLIDTAIPCGLILNELISNSLKHAFPKGREGEIKIRLRRMESGEIQLSVADNGIGMPAGFDLRRDGHLGLQNVFVIGERQLCGKVVFDANPGVTCHVHFKDDLYKPRV